MPPNTPALTANQKRFVAEYAVDRIAVQAYFRAFGRNTSKGKRRAYFAAAEQARRLLEKPEIQAELEAAATVHRRHCRTDANRINRELAAIAFADPDDLYEPDPQNHGLPAPRPWRDIPPHARRAVQSVKIKRRRLVSKERDADGKPVLEAWEVEELEYRLYPKTDALDKLCRRLGLYKDLPPLEMILAALPPELAGPVRAAIAASVLAASGAGGGSVGAGGSPQAGPAGQVSK